MTREELNKNLNKRLEEICSCQTCENERITEEEEGRGRMIVSAFTLIGSILLAAALILLVLFTQAKKAHAEEYTDNAIVTAIGKAENSKNFPYGIKSVKCSGEKECRQICLNSVRNGRARWIKAGKPCDLITFIGLRYSPPATNPNWVRLVKYFLRKDSAK